MILHDFGCLFLPTIAPIRIAVCPTKKEIAKKSSDGRDAVTPPQKILHLKDVKFHDSARESNSPQILHCTYNSMAKPTRMPSSRFDGAPIDQPTMKELLLDSARVIITILQQMCQPRGVL